MSRLLEAIDLKRYFPVHRNGETRWLHAVDGVSLDVGKGETVGLVGESGCGKSTLVRLLTRTLDPDDGQVRFRNLDLALIRARDMALNPQRGRIQMVFQDPTDSLNPRYTARQTIAESARLLLNVAGAELAARVEEAASWVGLAPELLDRYPHQLSGGQKARVGIARAIVSRPTLLVLDEPTAALDVSVQTVILQLLERLKEELAMSVLFVSHDLNVVRLLCDRVLVMYLGQVVESGPTGEVFRAPAHPYTRALIAALPGGIEGGQASAADVLIGGEAQSPIEPVPGRCRLLGRCPRAQALCGECGTTLVDIGGERRVACHFPTETRHASQQ
jgi:oligopeptide/dipeptide ABC transporter ATP-binding protein